jgi:hypothetical protein
MACEDEIAGMQTIGDVLFHVEKTEPHVGWLRSSRGNLFAIQRLSANRPQTAETNQSFSRGRFDVLLVGYRVRG